MTVFVDTSALIAILVNEIEANRLLAFAKEASLLVTSPVVIVEAAMVLSTKIDIDPTAAEKMIREFLDRSKVAIVTVNDVTASLAIDAFRSFGKGRGHPARLNMADCFSYACAKQHRVPLLYVGNDFAQTDLA